MTSLLTTAALNATVPIKKSLNMGDPVAFDADTMRWDVPCPRSSEMYSARFQATPREMTNVASKEEPSKPAANKACAHVLPRSGSNGTRKASPMFKLRRSTPCDCLAKVISTEHITSC
eukprot:4938776-Amphidinium_carterae.1